MDTDIFISYRRADSKEQADHLYNDLQREFGKDQVFMDTSSIHLGDPWPEKLDATLKSAQMVLIVIGPGWLEAKDENGVRRIENKDDWVRLELTKSLKYDHIIIPVLVNNATLGGHVVIDGTAMYQSFRNNAASGPYGAFDGERIPNKPYLAASGGARVQLRDQIVRGDEITLGYGLRYTHAFDRDWSSLGAEDARQVIPTQWLHHVAAGYRVRGPRVDLSTTLEVSNLSDAPAYDYFRVQRPGRAFHVKTSVAF